MYFHIRTPAVCFWLVVFFAVGLPHIASQSFGRIDRGFGDRGLLEIGIPGLLPLGLFATSNGGSVVPSSYVGNSGPELWRINLLPDGSPDPAATLNGATKVPASEGLMALWAASQIDEKVLYVGKRWGEGTRYDMFVARVNPNGELDPSFADNGVLVRDLSIGGLPSDEEAGWAVQLGDGRILIAGTISRLVEPPLSEHSAFLIQLTPDGGIDETFGTNGVVTIPLGSGNSSSSTIRLHIQSDNKILAGVSVHIVGTKPLGRSAQEIYRFTPEGIFDTSFSTDGFVALSTDMPGPFTYLTTRSDGKILSLSAGLQLNRLLPDGSFDPSFGVDGRKTIQNMYPHSISVLPNGKLLGSGTNMAWTDAAIGRYFDDGTPDIRFGRGGVVPMRRVGARTTLGFTKSLSNSSLLIAGVLRIDGENPTRQRPFVMRFHAGK